MKISRTVLFGTMLAALIMAAPVIAQARPFEQGYGPHRGGWQQCVPQEKQQAFRQALEQHRDKMHPIREQIWVKKTTLDALSRNPNTDSKDIVALVNEISALRNQAHTERKAFSEMMRKDFGMDMPCGPMQGGPRGEYGNCGFRGGFHGGPHGGRGGW